MIRRPAWLVAGVVLGAGGTIWAQRQVRRAVARLEPDNVAREAAKSARELAGRLGERVLDAVEAGRSAREEREGELRRELDLKAPGVVTTHR